MERSGQSVPVLWGRRSLGSTELSVSNPQELEARARNGTPADALHRAGLTYLARAQATTR